MSATHVVHIQLEIRRQFINEGSLFVTDPVALQRCIELASYDGPAQEYAASPACLCRSLSSFRASGGKTERYEGKRRTRMRGCFSSGCLG